MKISRFSAATARVIAPLACVVVLANSACGKDDEASETAAAVTASALVGTWKTDCVKDEENQFVIDTHVFTATDYTLTNKTYSKAGCADADILFSSSAGGTYKAAGSNFDLNVNLLTVTPQSDAMTTGFKAACSTLTWTKGTTTDVKTCDVFKDKVAMQYSIYKIDGTKLTVGKESDAKDGTTEAKRHSEYNTTAVATKQ